MTWLLLLILVPVAGGSVYSLLTLWAAARFFGRPFPGDPNFTPPVSVLKPCYGMDRDMEANLRSICEQDYPDYQVVLSVQRLDDPCWPLLRDFEARYPSRVTVIAEESEPVVNGKVQNMLIGLKAAQHEILVINDSDAFVAPDYLRRMVAPLSSHLVGYTCSLYRCVGATNVPEALEVLGINTDFVPSLIFAHETGASQFCLGASTATRQVGLKSVGGMQVLADYLVEDYEMGRRLRGAGFDYHIVPTFVDLSAHYESFGDWFNHWVYWDQNTKAANPMGFFLTVLTRAVPFAILFAVLTINLTGLIVLLVTLAIRLGVTAILSSRYLGDRDTLRWLWLLPIRDCIGLLSWALALFKRHFIWRGHTFKLGKGGRIIPRDTRQPARR
jgi:ceramide glucosyltransferase